MSVEFNNFEGCCTAVILTDFGQSKTSEYGYSDIGHKRLRKETIEQVKYAQEEGNGIVTAIITSQQTRAADVLKELGFIGTGAAQKARHSEVTIELYYLHCKDWKAPEEPVEAPRPRDANGRFLPAQQEAVNPFVAAPQDVEVGNDPLDVQPGRWKAKFTNISREYIGVVNRDSSVGNARVPKIFTTEEKNRLTNARFNRNFTTLFWVQV